MIMHRAFLVLTVGGLLAAATSVVFGQPTMVRPDLLPDPGAQQPPYCRKNPQGNLVVTVRAVGPSTNAPLAPFHVKVVFNPGGTVEKQVQGLVSGSTADLPVPIPPACGKDCKFTITVDSRNEIREADETNNTVEARCPGS